MYTYYDLSGDISYLNHFCVETGSIGETELGRKIPFVHIGAESGKQIIITGGIHAREHVSSLLVMKQIIYLLNNFPQVEKSAGGIYFVPMVNPDGNLICAFGKKSLPADRRFAECFAGKDLDAVLEKFKANANCVDLNTNFDARWGEGKHNVRFPSGANYIGRFPFSEKETRALRDFTLKVKPAATVSYHAIGREIYWQFGQSDEDMRRDTQIALYLNSFLNYRLVEDDGTSVGGYKDWCISALKIPSFTIELVSDEEYSHPLTDDKCIDEDFERNKNLPLNLLNFVINML